MISSDVLFAVARLVGADDGGVVEPAEAEGFGGFEHAAMRFAERKREAARGGGGEHEPHVFQMLREPGLRREIRR